MHSFYPHHQFYLIFFTFLEPGKHVHVNLKSKQISTDKIKLLNTNEQWSIYLSNINKQVVTSYVAHTSPKHAL